MKEHSLDALYIMTEYEQQLFQKSMQTLLNATFIIRQLDKDRELYRFVMANYHLCENYLSAMGWGLRKDEHLGIIACEGAASRNVSLNLEETLSTLILRLIYEDKRHEVSLAAEQIVRQYEFHEKYRALTERVFTKTRMRDVLHRLKMLKLIDYAGDELDPDLLIILYPSIAFIVDSDTINGAYEKLTALATQQWPTPEGAAVAEGGAEADDGEADDGEADDGEGDGDADDAGHETNRENVPTIKLSTSEAGENVEA